MTNRGFDTNVWSKKRGRKRSEDEIGVQPLGGSCNYSSGGKRREGKEVEMKKSREPGFAVMSLRK